MADQFIGINVRGRNKDAEPWVEDERGNRIRLPLNQPVLLTRSQGARLLSHHSNTCVMMTLKDWQAKTQKKTKLLILRSQGIGDIILLTPVLRKLAAIYDEIHVGLRNDHRPVLSECPYVTKLWDHDIKGEGNAPLKDPSFVKVMDLNYWAEEKDDKRSQLHRTLCFARGAKIELAENEMEPDLFVAKEWIARGKELLRREKGKRYVGIQMAGSHSYRNFWLEHDKPPFPQHSALVSAIADAGMVPVLLCHYRKLGEIDSRAVDMQGRLSLSETIGVINQCDALVGADSGLVHVSLALGVPTVGMFGICSARFRTATYPTAKVDLVRVPCEGCGDYAMSHCRQPHGSEVGACMKFPVPEVVDAIRSLPARTIQPKIAAERPRAPAPSAPAVIIPGKSGSNGVGLWMTLMFQDETREHMQRFADRVISHAAIEHVIAVDGGCTTGAEKVLESIGKVEVHRIPYCREYWNAQAHQRNACFSFVKDHRPVFFMDPDEAFSEGLSGWLKEFPHLGIEYGLVARATWDREDEARAQSYRPPGTHNWPDYQPRFYRWRQHYKFHGAAHHVTLGCPEPVLIDKKCYVLHYEEEGGRRAEREAQWAAMMEQKKARVG